MFYNASAIFRLNPQKNSDPSNYNIVTLMKKSISVVVGGNGLWTSCVALWGYCHDISNLGHSYVRTKNDVNNMYGIEIQYGGVLSGRTIWLIGSNASAYVTTQTLPTSLSAATYNTTVQSSLTSVTKALRRSRFTHVSYRSRLLLVPGILFSFTNQREYIDKLWTQIYVYVNLNYIQTHSLS